MTDKGEYGEPGELGSISENGEGGRGGRGGRGGQGGQGLRGEQGKQGRNAPKRAMIGYAILALALILLAIGVWHNDTRINNICDNSPTLCNK